MDGQKKESPLMNFATSSPPWLPGWSPLWEVGTEGLLTFTLLLASAGPTGKQNRKEAGAPVWGAQRVGFGVVLPRDTARSLGEQNTTQRLALVQTVQGQEMDPWREDVSPERADGW